MCVCCFVVALFMIITSTAIQLQAPWHNHITMKFHFPGRSTAVVCGTFATAAAAIMSVPRNAKERHEITHKKRHEATPKPKKKYKKAVNVSRDLVKRYRTSTGAPGVSIAVSVDGNVVWADGFGYCNIETLEPCTSDALMRIASISKPITMCVIARLMEQGKVDLDEKVQKYVKNYPPTRFEGNDVDLRVRHLVSNLGCIRHYKKTEGSEFDASEYYNRTNYKTTADALEMFKHDPLECKPGTKFLYSTFGWTLLSAVAEGAAGEDATFANLVKKLTDELGMMRTTTDVNGALIANRSKYYVWNEKLRMLVNVPEVDNSYKWAGGGLLSTVQDLLRFANSLLHAQQSTDGGFLKSSTVNEMWTPVEGTQDSVGWVKEHAGGYGQGFSVVLPNRRADRRSLLSDGYVGHTGGAIGATSVLFITSPPSDCPPPHGIVVAILVNLQASPGVNKLAFNIASAFRDIYLEN